jgi:hypothetical protein
MNSKICSKCKQEKETSNFSKNKASNDGYGVWCKSCNLANLAVWKKLNADKVIEQKNKYYELNKDKEKERLKKYRTLNKEKVSALKRKRRALMLGNESTPYTLQEVFEAYGFICHICNNEINMSAPRQPGKYGWEFGLHIDHFVPLSKGGANSLSNVRPSHGVCNLKKGSRVI